ncbi:MAG: sigma factor-like helix-turn-helix DNA-binding protein [Candidatus Hydrogenedentales bacterium]|jgi:DNA-directed RNA polymerase specialized sigma24 family protein
MYVRIRPERFTYSTNPLFLLDIASARRAWYETEDEVRAGIRWGKRKAELLQWVRRKMQRKLTARERRCIELYYFQGLTYAKVACVTGTNASSVLRAVRRSVNRLRAIAQLEGVTIRQGVPKERRLRNPGARR